MEKTKTEKDILSWIDSVSKLRPKLGGHAICPFAAKSKYLIVECPAEEIKVVEGYDVIIYVVEDHFSLEEVQAWVNYHNQRHTEWKFFEDCSSNVTYINGIQTSNPKYNLILSQPTQKLRRFREKLAKTDYYDLWDEEYLKEILQDDIDIMQNRDRNPVKSSDLPKSGENHEKTSR